MAQSRQQSQMTRLGDKSKIADLVLSNFTNLTKKNKFICLLSNNFSVPLHSTVGEYCPLLAKCSNLNMWGFVILLKYRDHKKKIISMNENDFKVNQVYLTTVHVYFIV